jgi:AcrR family transcriptional regulator
MSSSIRGQSSGSRRRPYAPRLPPEQRREQLLDAALTLIVDQGYAGVSIEAVARLAGVTRPVVYDHFPNLGRLLAALVEREERYAVSQLDQIVPAEIGSADPQELLIGGVERFVEAVLTRPDTWRIILLPIDGTPAIIREQVETNRARMRERIAGLLGWTAALPDFPTDLDIELLSYTILHLAEEAGRLALTDPDRFSPARFERFARSFVGLIWPHDAPAD